MPPKQIEKGKERLQIQGPQITTPPHTKINQKLNARQKTKLYKLISQKLKVKTRNL